MSKQKPTNCDLCRKELKGKEVNMGTCEDCMMEILKVTPGKKEEGKDRDLFRESYLDYIQKT